MPSYVIVGASRGLGYQFLKTLSRDPNNTVIGLVRTPSTTEAKIAADNLSNVHIIQGDLTSPSSLAAAASRVSTLTNGAVDYLIVNGAYLTTTTMTLNPSDYVGKEDFFLSEMNASMATNVAGVLYSVNAFMPLVLKSPIKKVVVISTGLVDEEFVVKTEIAGSIPYSLSKTAVNLLVLKFAVEYKREGVVFLALSPGLVNTMVEDLCDLPPEVAAVFKEMIKAFRKYEPEFRGSITPEESVDMQLKVIEGVTVKDSGAFLSNKGNKRWL